MPGFYVLKILLPKIKYLTVKYNVLEDGKDIIFNKLTSWFETDNTLKMSYCDYVNLGIDTLYSLHVLLSEIERIAHDERDIELIHVLRYNLKFYIHELESEFKQIENIDGMLIEKLNEIRAYQMHAKGKL